MLITFGWFTEHGRPFDAQATGFHCRLRHFVDSRVPESWRREVVEGRGWGMFGAAANSLGWNWNLVSRDQDGLVATVGLPVGLDDTVLSSGPIGVGRGVLAGRSVLDGVVPPFGILATDGTRFAAQQDWFGMASIYLYRSHGVVAFSNRPILLPYVFGDAIHPDAEGFARYAACDAFVGSISPVMGVKPLGPGEVFVGKRKRNKTWKISVSRGSCLDDAAVAGAKLDAGADLDALAVASFSRATSSLARLWPTTDLLRCGLSGGRDSRLLAANLLAGGEPGAHLANSAVQLPTNHVVRDAGVRLGGHRSPTAADEALCFHRRLTERLLPEWAGVNYVQGVGVAERTPHIWGRGRPKTPHRALRQHHDQADLDARPEQSQDRPEPAPPRGVGWHDVEREPAAHDVRSTCRGGA